MITYLGDAAFSVERAGKKAANLHRLAQAGFPVPGGFVLYHGEALDDEGLTEAITRIGGFPVAVRSSGVFEDLAGASFAGQYETFLHVRTHEELRTRIEACRASAKAERVVAYLEKYKLPPEKATLAVLVQRMIEPSMAGVAFSLHPLTGREEHGLVEAVEGLGERLVSGQAAPSSFTIDLRTGAIVEQRLEDTKAVLSPTQAKVFAGRLLELQAHFGRPQDVEWAIDGEGALWILQARPITTVKWRTDLDERSTSNMREGGIASRVCYPLVQSLIGGLMKSSLGAYLQSVFLFDNDPAINWMRLLYGRPYWNTTVLKHAMGKLPGFNEETFDRAMGIQRDYGPEGPKRTPVSVQTVAKALPTALAVKLWYPRTRRLLRGHRETFELRERALLAQSDHFPSLSDEAFSVLFRRVVHELYTWNETVYLVTGYTNNSAQREFLELLTGLDKATNATTDSLKLMGGLEGIFHLDVNRELDRLAALAREHGFESPAWQRGLGAFLANYGFHGDHELDLSEPRWGEQPERVETLVKALLASGRRHGDAKDREQAQRHEYEAAVAEIEQRLRGSLTLQLRYLLPFRTALARMREFLKTKEQLRELSTRSYLVVRKYVLEAARRLQLRGVLAQRDDVYFFEMRELLERFPNRPLESGLADDLHHRKQMYLGYRDFEPPEEFGASQTYLASAETPTDGALRGVGCSPGVAEGTARVILSVDELHKLQDGDVLVTRFTDPGWTPALGLVRGIVTEVGGVLSHAAVIGREYGIPTVLNLKGATSQLHSGQRVRVDGTRGLVFVLEGESRT